MLELLAPAGSPEAVVAAVQNGADAVYMGLGSFNARRGAKNFTNEEFERAVRYCRIRGCKIYVTMNTLVGDREMESAVKLARYVSDVGADAILVQDIGLADVLRKAVPDIPLHASTQMSVHDLAGAEAAAQMGMTRVVLARELSYDEIKFISQKSPIETEIFVHGALCFCHSGQCYMSALIGRRSGNRGMCAQPCRMEYSMGARLEDKHPLSLKDNCLAGCLQKIEDAGVACVKIEGRMKRPEYTGIVTGIYSRLIKDHRAPTAEEMETLNAAFSRQGFTQGYFNGDKKNMFGYRSESEKPDESLFSDARKEYIGKEEHRVPIKMYAVVNPGEVVRAAATDDRGNKVVIFGGEPQKAIRQAIDSEAFSERLAKTGGTPYYCTDVQSRVGKGLYLPASEINELRRRLVSELSEKRALPPKRRSLPMPPMPTARYLTRAPKIICQVENAEQLSVDLAAEKPDYIYIPLHIMRSRFDLAEMFADGGVIPVAVLPRVICDDEVPEIYKTLTELKKRGIDEALVGNIGHIALARRAGMQIRGDFGMNVFNSYSMDMMRKMGFLSATVSFELRLAQIRDMQKCVPAEVISYGRLPLMISDQDIISHSLGTNARGNTASLSDRMGQAFPVVREPDGRTTIYNSRKLFMADKEDELRIADVWGERLMFTTEGARECVQILKRYKGMGDYTPNDLTRGLYYRGVE